MSLIKLNSNFGAIYESIKKFIFNDLFTDVTLVSDDMQKYSAHMQPCTAGTLTIMPSIYQFSHDSSCKRI